jgi:hypothetical protein
MDHLLDRIQTLERHVQSLQQQTTSVARRLRWWRRLACSVAVLTVFGLPLSLGAGPEDGKGLPQRITALERKLETLERKLEHVTSVIGPDGFPELVITGANLRIVNGLGSTDCGAQEQPIPSCPNGVGNLIVGYNELRRADDVRTGSHNVVVGMEHNFSRFGGLVVGRFNTISGDFSSVSGGNINTAGGFLSSVSGGQRNTASGNSASVSGGFGNNALSDLSSVSGGGGNTANGPVSSVSGGRRNIASGNSASVSGGEQNTASGFGASVSGGLRNTALGEGFSSVSGGVLNIASGASASVSGGEANTASGFLSSVSGGGNRTAEAELDWVAGGLFQDQ